MEESDNISDDSDSDVVGDTFYSNNEQEEEEATANACSTKEFSEEVEEERMLVLEALKDVQFEAPDLDTALGMFSKICAYTHVFYQDILPMVLDGRQFLIDGDGLLLYALSSKSLSADAGGQTLHLVYVVEKFLHSLNMKGLRFAIFFSKAWSLYWPKLSVPIAIARHSLRLHLLNNTGFEVLDDMAAPWEVKFLYYIEKLRPSFFMTFTEVPNNFYGRGQKVSCREESQQLLTFLIRSQLIACSVLNVDVVDIDSTYVRTSSLFANVYVPSAQMFMMDISVIKIVCSVLRTIPKNTEELSLDINVCMSSLSPYLSDGRRLVIIIALASFLKEQGNSESTFIMMCVIVLHTVLLSYLPLKLRCFKELPNLPSNVFIRLSEFHHELLLALNEVTSQNFLANKLSVDFHSAADLWHGQLLKALFHSVGILGGLQREMLEENIATEYEQLCGTISSIVGLEKKDPYFSINDFQDEGLKILKASPNRTINNKSHYNISNSNSLIIHIDRLIPLSCKLTKLFCAEIIGKNEEKSQPDIEMQKLLTMITNKKKIFEEVIHWHGNKPMTDEIDRIPEKKLPENVPAFKLQYMRNTLARFNTYYGLSLEGSTKAMVIPSGKRIADPQSWQHEVSCVATDIKTVNIKGKQVKKVKNMNTSSKGQQIIQENLKRKASQEIKQAEERLKHFNSLCENLVQKGQYLTVAQSCDTEVEKLSVIKHEPSLWLQVLLRKADALFKHWCVVECDDYQMKKGKRNIQYVRDLFTTVKDILRLSDKDCFVWRAKDQRLVSRILFSLGFEDLARLWKLPEYDKAIDKKFSLKMNHVEFQLQHMSCYLDRDSGMEPDIRVKGFCPDPWQRELFDIIDKNQSAVVVAPTSSGKTYASYYCMEKVIRTSDDGVVVYVCPTKALVNQVYATIFAKFKKAMPPGKSLQGVFTRDFRENVSCCQILVTVPECLELLLLSPRKHSWSKQLRYVIFDEVHCLVGQGGGLSWENALLLIRCPFLALSATITDPEAFVSWLQNAENYKCDQKFSNRPPQSYKVHLVVHTDRYNHLKKKVLHMDGSVEPVHPYALLDEALLEECRGVPKHITLSPDEALQLYHAMKNRLTSDQQERLSPCNYFKSFSKGFLTMSSVKLFSAELREALEALPKDIVMKVLAAFRLSNFEAECSLRTVHDNSVALMKYLKANQMLPSIVFSYNRKMVDALPLKILRYFEEQDTDETEDDDSSVEEVEYSLQKQSKKQERRRKTTIKFKKNLKLLGGPTEQSHVSVRGAGHIDEKVVKFIEWRLIKTGHSSNGHFSRMLRRGLGKHHSGMNNKERSAVEMLFRMKMLKLVTATGTLALGIHMPCKSVVIAGDSPYLNALEYHQMSGRAGRRGFDTVGNVIFFGLNQRKIKTLMTANVPKMVGNFPISLSLVLRLLLLTSNVTDLENISDEATEAAISSCFVLLENGLLYESYPRLKQQIKYFFLFAHQFFICQGLLNVSGNPLHASGLVTHLHYHEPGNFAFVYLLNKDVLEMLCETDLKGNVTYESLIQIMVLLSFLFARLPFRERLRAGKWNNSEVILPKLHFSIYQALKEYNKEVLQIFSHYHNCVSDYICSAVGEDNTLPVSQQKFPSAKTSKNISCPLVSEINNICISNNVCSAFAGLSGNSDYDLYPSEEGINNIRHDVDSFVKLVPTIELDVELNAYALDFFKHGIRDAISKENGLRSGEDFHLLQDFLMTVLTITTSLSELCSSSKLLLAMQQIKRIYSANFNKSYPGYTKI